MRRGILLFLVVLASLLILAVHQVWNLLGLLVYTGRDDAIAKSELPAPGSEPNYDRPQMIPKIIHQTTKNATIPPVWKDAHESCRAMHPAEDGWTHYLWTDEKSSAFIAKEYPWFAATFEAYPYPIQRADAIRYFVLSHYGGVYIDMDDGCNRPLDPLLSYPAWVRKTIPTGISNDAMGSVPRHPFFMRAIDELRAYNRNWIMPYITVMGSTGPLFLSVLWRRYTAEGLNVGDGEDGGRIRILFPEEYQNYPWSFFTHHLGNSWHGADVELIFWVRRHPPFLTLSPLALSPPTDDPHQMARNWLLLTIFGFALGGSAIFAIWWAYRRFVLHLPIAASLGGSGSAPVPKWKASSIRSRFGFWRRRSARKEYELVSRHEV